MNENSDNIKTIGTRRLPLHERVKIRVMAALSPSLVFVQRVEVDTDERPIVTDVFSVNDVDYAIENEEKIIQDSNLAYLQPPFDEHIGRVVLCPRRHPTLNIVEMQRAIILVNQIIEQNNEQHVYVRYVDTGECRWANIAEMRLLPDVDKAVNEENELNSIDTSLSVHEMRVPADVHAVRVLDPIEPWSSEACTRTRNWALQFNHRMLVASFTAVTNANNEQVVYLPTEKVQVWVEVWVQEITEISDITSDFLIDMYISEKWIDPALNYEDRHSCRTNISLSSDMLKKIWTPRLSCMTFVFSSLVELACIGYLGRDSDQTTMMSKPAREAVDSNNRLNYGSNGSAVPLKLDRGKARISKKARHMLEAMVPPYNDYGYIPPGMQSQQCTPPTENCACTQPLLPLPSSGHDHQYEYLIIGEGLLTKLWRKLSHMHKEDLALRIDQICSISFPALFALFNILYWSIYLSGTMLTLPDGDVIPTLTRLESPLDERFQSESPSDSTSLITPDYVIMLKTMLCEEEMADKLRATSVKIPNEPEYLPMPSMHKFASDHMYDHWRLRVAYKSKNGDGAIEDKYAIDRANVEMKNRQAFVNCLSAKLRGTIYDGRRASQSGVVCASNNLGNRPDVLFSNDRIDRRDVKVVYGIVANATLKSIPNSISIYPLPRNLDIRDEVAVEQMIKAVVEFVTDVRADVAKFYSSPRHRSMVSPNRLLALLRHKDCVPVICRQPHELRKHHETSLNNMPFHRCVVVPTVSTMDRLFTAHGADTDILVELIDCGVACMVNTKRIYQMHESHKCIPRLTLPMTLSMLSQDEPDMHIFRNMPDAMNNVVKLLIDENSSSLSAYDVHMTNMDKFGDDRFTYRLSDKLPGYKRKHNLRCFGRLASGRGDSTDESDTSTDEFE